MLKVLLIIFLVLYCFYKVGGFLLKSFFVGQQAQRPYDAHQKRKPEDGNVYVDTQSQPKSKKDKNFNGGEYVDYEELD
ncbi:MAG: DUF4834 family protein [bacterium]|jgi:hypothetical protein|nr:DUF4834 family protein [bacterium]